MLYAAKTIAPINSYLNRAGNFAQPEVKIGRSFPAVPVATVDLSG